MINIFPEGYFHDQWHAKDLEKNPQRHFPKDVMNCYDMFNACCSCMQFWTNFLKIKYEYSAREDIWTLTGDISEDGNVIGSEFEHHFKRKRRF